MKTYNGIIKVVIPGTNLYEERFVKGLSNEREWYIYDDFINHYFNPISDKYQTKLTYDCLTTKERAINLQIQINYMLSKNFFKKRKITKKEKDILLLKEIIK